MQFFTGIYRNTQSKSICHHWLSVSWISKITHCGILINMPYYHAQLSDGMDPFYGCSTGQHYMSYMYTAYLRYCTEVEHWLVFDSGHIFYDIWNMWKCICHQIIQALDGLYRIFRWFEILQPLPIFAPNLCGTNIYIMRWRNDEVITQSPNFAWWFTVFVHQLT